MEPKDDRQLRKLLQEWRVEDAPESLDARVLGPRQAPFKDPWWRSLWTGSIRIPMPIALSCAAAVIWMGVELTRQSSAAPPPVASQPGVSLAEYQPTEMHVRLIRSGK
jgi:hypothetical protein